MGLIPGLAQWVKDPTLPQAMASHIAVAVAVADGYGSESASSLGTFICRCGTKKTKRKKKRERARKEKGLSKALTNGFQKYQRVCGTQHLMTSREE